MCKTPVITSFKASTKYTYHSKKILIVEGTTGKKFLYYKKIPCSCQCGLGSLIPHYLPSLIFIMIGFLMGDINIQCFNMLVTSVRKSQ